MSIIENRLVNIESLKDLGNSSESSSSYEGESGVAGRFFHLVLGSLEKSITVNLFIDIRTLCFSCHA
ncbi:hypothetical protein H5410_060457 [Solanum commersonii]|uniref:Uncharacterized protein n=1 Tax=Solanum commersonii TaxID=4109 RepID=A0A9J5W546_SOLCO|nr:hypothetical protein H5410_060457 [Solanum commersonii]